MALDNDTREDQQTLRQFQPVVNNCLYFQQLWHISYAKEYATKTVLIRTYTPCMLMDIR
jgi:hypothetical protein